MSIFNKITLVPFGVFTGVAPFAANAIPYAATLRDNRNFMWWRQAFYVSAPNDVTNYWTIQMQGLGNGDPVIANFLSNIKPAGAWQNNEITTFNNLASVLNGVYIQVILTGAPGNLFLAGPELAITYP